MNVRHKAVIYAIIILLAIFVPNTCLAVFGEDITTDVKTVRYQSEIDYPPFKYIDKNILTGFDIDFTSLVFLKTDYNLVISTGKWPETYERLRTSQIDTAGIIAVTDERKNEILYSNVIFESHIAVFMKKDASYKAYKRLTLEELKNYRIGTGTKQYSESILLREVGLQPYKTFETIEKGIEALNNDEIDILFENQEVVNYFLIKKGLQDVIEPKLANLFPVEAAYGVSKNKPELVTYINKRINALQKSGVYEELYRRHFFTHSAYFRESQSSKLTMTLVLAILGVIAAFLLLQMYIAFLKRKLEFEKKELKAANEELVAAEVELKKQYDKLSRKGEELRLSEERYKLAVDGVNDGIWDWDNEKNNIFISSRCWSILGYKENEQTNRLDVLVKNIHPDDREKFTKAIESYISGKSKRLFQMELRIKTGTGDYKWVLIKGKAIFNQDEVLIRMAGSLTDINDRKLAEEKIHQMAYYDNLTGLPNRTLLMDRFSIAAANALRKKRMVAICFLDLDNFKTINDTLGHTYGDELITDVGQFIKEQMRKGDTIARLGGDEFIIMQPNIKEIEEVTRMTSRLLASFKQPWILAGREFYISASIGITVFPDDGQDMQTLMKNADTAMYRAKELGKNNFQLYTESLNKRMLQKLGMENDLRKALERNELVIHYQPQIELQTNKIVCMEALLRWQHPVKGLMNAKEFMSIAEETGLIVPIGEWVFKTAFTQLKKWHDDGNDSLKLSINISSRQFMQRNIVNIISAAISEAGVKPEWIELEVNEMIAFRDLDYTLATLHSIKEMGLGIILDDFCSGYSSLNYLKQMPIDNIKIDKTYIHDMTEGSSEAMIVKALISLAHDLNIKVTAEGVETMDKLELLSKEKCDMIQGYIFSTPLSEDAVGEYEDIEGNFLLQRNSSR